MFSKKSEKRIDDKVKGSVYQLDMKVMVEVKLKESYNAVDIVSIDLTKLLEADTDTMSKLIVEEVEGILDDINSEARHMIKRSPFLSDGFNKEEKD